MKTLMIPVCDGGIYEIEDDGRHVTVSFWEKDVSWNCPGSVILCFDTDNSIILESQELTIFEWNVLIEYLKHMDKLGADNYLFAELKIKK